MTSAVKLFTNAQAGAPSLNDSWGALTTFLDAILVDGFNLKALDTLTFASGVATATVSAGHGYEVGQYILVSGADQPEFNGEFRVTEANTTTFKFKLASGAAPTSPATTSTSLSAKVAPLDFEKAFSSTNKRAYRSKNPASNRMFLRVDDNRPLGYSQDNWAKHARVTIAEAMTDIDTMLGARAPFRSTNPTLNEVPTGTGTQTIAGWARWYWSKSGATTADSYDTTLSSPAYNTPTRPWAVLGDDRGFYLLVNWHGFSTSYNGRQLYAFQEFESLSPEDPFRTILLATEFTGTAESGSGAVDNLTQQAYSKNYLGRFIPRDSYGLGDSTRVMYGTLDVNTSTNYTPISNMGILKFPNPIDYGFIFSDIHLIENDPSNNGYTFIRGKFPGMKWIPHRQPFAHFTRLDHVKDHPDKEFMVWTMANSGSTNNDAGFLFDITGPWR